jgi:hypothetical protein
MTFVRSGWRATNSSHAYAQASSMTCGRAVTSRATTMSSLRWRRRDRSLSAPRSGRQMRPEIVEAMAASLWMVKHERPPLPHRRRVRRRLCEVVVDRRDGRTDGGGDLVDRLPLVAQGPHPTRGGSPTAAVEKGCGGQEIAELVRLKPGANRLRHPDAHPLASS